MNLGRVQRTGGSIDGQVEVHRSIASDTALSYHANHVINHPKSGTAMTEIDIDAIDYFRGKELYGTPTPTSSRSVSGAPVAREPIPERVHGDRSRRGHLRVPRPEVMVELQHGERALREDVGPARRRRHHRDHQEHRDELPFSDQLPSFDPPEHTAQRGLLMRLITPKRLKENEAFLWSFADETIDTFVGKGECELLRDYAIPYTLMVIADLLGVPDEDQAAFLEHLTRKAAPRDGAQATRVPLRAVHALHRGPPCRSAGRRHDGMATARFPDGRCRRSTTSCGLPQISLPPEGDDGPAPWYVLRTLGRPSGDPATAPGRPRPGCRSSKRCSAPSAHEGHLQPVAGLPTTVGGDRDPGGSNVW